MYLVAGACYEMLEMGESGDINLVYPVTIKQEVEEGGEEADTRISTDASIGIDEDVEEVGDVIQKKIKVEVEETCRDVSEVKHEETVAAYVTQCEETSIGIDEELGEVAHNKIKVEETYSDNFLCVVKQEAANTCSLCGEIFRLLYELYAHKMAAHVTQAEETSYGVDISDVRDTHKKIKVEVEYGVGCDVKQEAVISCSLCGQIFRLPSELGAHAMEAPTTLVEETSLGLDVRDTQENKGRISVGCDVKQQAVISCSLVGHIFRLPSEFSAHVMEAHTTLVEETSLGLDSQDTQKKIKLEVEDGVDFDVKQVAAISCSLWSDIQTSI